MTCVYVCIAGGVDTISSTLHWGPYYGADPYQLTHGEYKLPSSDFNSDFHTFGLYWDEDKLYTYLDDDSKHIMDVDFTSSTFFEKGGWDSSTTHNPWVNGGKNAPFDQDFYLVFNVAVGGVSGFFPDGQGNKPWSDTSSAAMSSFYGAKNTWYSTWNDEDSALQIKSVRVWQ